LIPSSDKAQLQELFKEKLLNEVKLIVFTQETECRFCQETRQLVDELSSLSDKIMFESYDFVKDVDKANDYGVDKIPAVLIVGERDYGIRFYGLPSGYEFASLIEDILDVSSGVTHLSQETKNRLKTLNKPIHIQVFVTPTCPYCPRMVRLAHQFAIETTFIKADMVEAVEFPQLVYKYRVMGVPKVVINETTEFVGMLPEELFLAQVLGSIGSPSMVV